MEDRHREIIRKARTLFVRDLDNLPHVCDTLFEFQILTSSMVEEILSQASREGKVRKLLDTIVRRGSTSFDYFHQALVDSKQQFLADILKPELAAHQHPAWDGISKDKRSNFQKAKSVDHSILEYKRQTSEEQEKLRQISENQQNFSNLRQTVPAGNASLHPTNFEMRDRIWSSGGEYSQSTVEKPEYHENNYITSKNESRVVQPEEDVIVTQVEEEGQLPQEWPSHEDHARPTHVEVRQFNIQEPGSFPLLQQNDHYFMTNSPRGKLVVINNSRFDEATNLPDRCTADMDSTSIDLLFRQMDFERKIYKNHSAQQIVEVLDKELAKKDKLMEYQCFVVIIMSHGCGKTIYGKDGQEICIDSLLNKFSDSNCPELAGKPKLFFIQACQYDKTREESIGHDFDSLGDELQELLGSANFKQTQPETTLVKLVDMFVARAVTTESLKWKTEERGSKFIQALVYVFKKLAYSEDLGSMICKVNQLVSKGDESRNIVEFTSTLTKKLIFFPGFPPKNRIERRPSQTEETKL